MPRSNLAGHVLLDRILRHAGFATAKPAICA
jgi:hypothetical protein